MRKLKPLPKCKKYKTVKAALIGVRSILKDKRRWTTETYARDSDGYPARDAREDDVVQVCIRGACYRLICDDQALLFQVDSAIEAACIDLHGLGIYGTNDGTPGYEGIMRALDRAIERA